MSTARGIAIIAALPREVRELVGRTAPDASFKRRGIYVYRLGSAIVATAGMGAARVALAFEAAQASGTIAEVISTGLAGACNPHVTTGSALEAGAVVDARTGERFRTAAGTDVLLVTGAEIAGTAEKARLAATYGASMVDMEAATLARLAQAHGLSFRAIKGISDAHDFEIASLARFADARGQFRTAAFALHTALRPKTWRPAAILGIDSNKALKALQEQLRELIAHPS